MRSWWREVLRQLGPLPTTGRLYEGIPQDRALAVLEPNARIRRRHDQGAQDGTVIGEVARPAIVFQSFSMTMIATHMTALAIKNGVTTAHE